MHTVVAVSQLWEPSLHGCDVGMCVGASDGARLVGSAVGVSVGASEGIAVGAAVAMQLLSALVLSGCGM